MVGAGLFTAFAPAAAAAGALLLLALGVAAVVAFCNATSSAQLAAHYPTSGGTYVYGRERLGPWWGFIAGWGFVIGKTASCAAMAMTFAAYVVPGAWQRPVAIAAVIGLATVNYHGVTRTARLARVLVTVVLDPPRGDPRRVASGAPPAPGRVGDRRRLGGGQPGQRRSSSSRSPGTRGSQRWGRRSRALAGPSRAPSSSPSPSWCRCMPSRGGSCSIDSVLSALAAGRGAPARRRREHAVCRLAHSRRHRGRCRRRPGRPSLAHRRRRTDLARHGTGGRPAQSLWHGCTTVCRTPRRRGRTRRRRLPARARRRPARRHRLLVLRGADLLRHRQRGGVHPDRAGPDLPARPSGDRSGRLCACWRSRCRSRPLSPVSSSCWRGSPVGRWSCGAGPAQGRDPGCPHPSALTERVHRSGSARGGSRRLGAGWPRREDHVQRHPYPHRQLDRSRHRRAAHTW